MRIIAYTYEADVHCIRCSRKRFGQFPGDTQDNEGNPIHPVFSTDEQTEPLYCGDCLEAIAYARGLDIGHAAEARIAPDTKTRSN